MKIEVIQTLSAMSAEYRIVCNGKDAGSAVVPNNFFYHKNDCHGVFAGTKFTIAHDSSLRADAREVGNGSLLSPYGLQVEGENVGFIDTRTDFNQPFWKRFEYTLMEFEADTYQMYGVGLGKGGIVNPIHRGGRQVAQINDQTTIRDNLNVYEALVEQQQDALPAVLLCLYKDIQGAAHRGEVATKSVKKVYMKTLNKALLAKYDPDFAGRC